MNPVDDWASTVAPPGSSLYYALRPLPPDARRAVAAVHAFGREVRAAARDVADPRVARLKLEWWRSEVDNAFAGRAQHPLAQALAPPVAAFALGREALTSVIDGVVADLEQPAYPTFAPLEEHCRRICGSLWLVSAVIAGGAGATCDQARTLGVALRLTAIIRDLGADVRRGRIYIPLDELGRFGVDVRALERLQVASNLTALLAHQASRAHAFYASARAATPGIDRRARRMLLAMAALGEALLREVERDGFRVLDRRLTLTPLAKAWIAWKASWTR